MKHTRKRIKFDDFPIFTFEKEFSKNEKNWMSKNKTVRHKKKSRMINAFYNNKKINPKNDFYNWVNRDWLKNFKVEEGNKYIVEFDDFRLVQRLVFSHLFEIVEDYLKTSKHTTFGKCLDTFYKSTKTFSTVTEIKSNANKMISKIDDLMINKDNLWKLMGLLNKTAGELNSVGLPFIYEMLPDESDPSTFRAALNGPGLIFVDINVYFDDGIDTKYKADYKKRYFKYITDLFETLFGKDNDFDPNDIYDTQVKLLNAFGGLTEKEDPNNYNKITKKEALTKYNFNWEEFCIEMGFTKVPDFFITRSVNYLKYGTELLLKEWNTKAFRTYFIYNYVRQTALFCKQTRDIIYEFRGKFERGEQKNFASQGIDGIFGLGCAFNTFLSNQYIKIYKNETNIRYLNVLMDELKHVFMRIIKNNNWLTPKTKSSAILKLNKLKLIVGSQPVLRKDPILHYTSNFLENMLLIFEWRFKQSLSLDGHVTNNVDIPTMDWGRYPPKFTGTQAYVVNASYTPSTNSIYVPLAYIQKPFIDIAMSRESILAHAGFTLAHEMSHCLDDWGSKYDHTGKLNDWWTKEDKIKFKKKENDVIEQYKEFAKRDGIVYDVEIGLGEDMSDISGLEICVEYLANLHTYKDIILPIQYLSFQKFFVYYAHQMRQKIFKRALQANLKTNPHPLDKYRTNIPLSRSIIFREIYKITKNDKMWWRNTDTIW